MEEDAKYVVVVNMPEEEDAAVHLQDTNIEDNTVTPMAIMSATVVNMKPQGKITI